MVEMLAPTSGTVTGDGRDRGRAPLGEQSGPDFYTTFGLTKIKV